jgi:glyoxylase-like metal-dependent hydrolase (beta-lactamase superfamily II)/rhodanese-related sulfurtransferase
MVFEQFYLECLSHASYLVGDTTSGHAVVVDPQRDVQQYIDRARELNLTITHVLETHFHADFLSGHLELAKATGATICYGSAAKPQFPAHLLEDGERLVLGDVVIETRHTPGHTPESVSYVVFEHADDATPYGVLTGDTLFIGDVGRPDLLVSVGKTADELGHMLFASIQNKLLTLPDPTRVFPAHGAGSACGKNLSTETSSTMGEQRRDNYALQFTNADAFVAAVTEGQPDAPGYFIYDAVLNQKDRATLDEHAEPARLSITQVIDARDGGTQIIDTRESQLFATGHLRGSINVGLSGRYAEYAGSVISPTDDIVIITDNGLATEAKVRLARIGYDRVIGWFPVDDLADVPSEVDRASRLTAGEFATRRSDIPNLQLVDVRGEGEFMINHVAHAVNIPVAQLEKRMSELRSDVPTVVYCAGGYRSSIAASVLRANGFADVSDVLGGFEAILQVQN